jgi:hypothetical protein
MHRPHLFAGIAASVLFLAPVALPAAHPWILPSFTVLGGEDAWATFDTAASDNLFIPDHQPMRLDNLKIWAPDGSEAKPENASTGRFRSSFDLHLTQQGTYKIANGMVMVMGGYMQGGEQKRLPRGTTADTIATAIPADATEVKISEMSSRIETFVTLGAPSDKVLKATGQGLEMEPVTHPADLVADEPAKLRFLIDGKPAAALAITLLSGGTRYRNVAGEIVLKTDKDGVVTIKWPAAGMYWVNATASDAKTSIPRATERRMNYSATLEVPAP